MCLKILRHRYTRTGFFLHYENELILKIIMKNHYLPWGTWLFRPHPPPPDSAPRSTSCQQPRPRPSWWSRRRWRRTPFLRTAGSQETRGSAGAVRRRARGFKSRPPRSLMPGGGGTRGEPGNRAQAQVGRWAHGPVSA